MLRVNSDTAAPRLIFDFTGSEDSSQREDIYNNFLQDAVADSINPIFDNEVTEFKPQSPNLNFYMFFSAFQNQEWLEQLKPNVEEDFGFYMSDAIADLTKEARKTITNPKTILQASGIPTPLQQYFFHKKRIQIMDELPYVVLDPVNALTSITPSKEGFPIFYNSFALPFFKNKDKWEGDALGFSNKTFLYNSFMLMEFYTSNNILTQKKIMAVPVYVNGRYMDYETNTKSIKQIRPVMLLNNSTEGFSVVWLKKYKLDRLDVRLSFWDALNGIQIPMLPSSDLSLSKKWVQNPSEFKQENLYLEFRFNYTNKTYGVYEYNDTTGAYDIQATSFDCYELVYDEYFSKLTRVPNQRPVIEEQTTDVFGNDIALQLSIGSLNKEVEATFNDNQDTYQIITKYNKISSHKGFFAQALHFLFDKKKVNLKDKALTYFERQFAENGTYNQDLGDVTITNTTDIDLSIRKIEVRNITLENKNNFFQGDPVSVNKFTKTGVDETPSQYLCDTLFTFTGSKFYSKLNPIKTPFDAMETTFYNKEAELYNSYYYDEANNKVIEKPQDDVNDILNQLEEGTKTKLLQDTLTKGGGIFSFLRNKKKYTTKVKGLTMNEKDLNLMLRSDILEKGGSTKKYQLLFPATSEKLTNKTEDYRDFGITIKTSLSPQYDNFGNGNVLTLNTDVIMGKDFFKLFISANDTLTINYEIAIQMVDRDGKVYKKIIPCSLKYT